MHHAENAAVEPEIRAERDYLAACQAALRQMRDEVATMMATGAGEGDAVLDKYHNHALRQFRAKQVTEMSGFDGAPLFFGRLDFPAGEVYEGNRGQDSPTRQPDADRVYVGRRGVRDEDRAHMVIDWRAPLARAFYEASLPEPMGVRSRRRYGFDHAGVLTAFEDEPLDHPRDDAGGHDLLAAEIERPRKGPMRDIVATIQPEQMRLVRAPLSRTLCIQGAPGTGKTAVGLHRLAYLLYTERDQLRKHGGVAVIGPNRSFLSYIRNVLPALGEVEVSQTAIDELLTERIPAAGTRGTVSDRGDAAPAATVKGDARMAEVIRRHLWARVRSVCESIEVQHQYRTWRLHTDEIAHELDALIDRGITYGDGPDMLAQRLAHLVLRQIEKSGHSSSNHTLRQLRRNKAVGQAVRRMWPKTEPAHLIFTLLTNPDALERASEGILSPEERQAILRTPRRRSVRAMSWTSHDLALIDEAAALIERPARLGHIVVDEAQDLSPMGLRAIARRMAGSCTILGDLAQATSPLAAQDWDTVLTHLNRPDGQIEELTRGYRVPAQIIDYAARLLPHIAPELTGPASYRQAPDALSITRVSPDQLTTTVMNLCSAALSQEGSVGLIAADSDVPVLHHTLLDQKVAHSLLGDEQQDEGFERLALVPVTLAKGLEFDTVLLIEPEQIVTAEPRGLQRLYVALTRAVSNLHIIHDAPLPAPIAQRAPERSIAATLPPR